jgi:DNA replication and repair protein RecF
MALTRLGLRDFRCFAEAELQLSPGVCVVVGENAAGKTSLLEAIHVLAQAKSFRTSDNASLIRTGTPGFQVTGRVTVGGREVPLGISRTGHRVQLRMDSNDAGVAEVAQAFPVRVLDTGAHTLLEGGPKERRRFLDWGVFHVEPEFLGAWRRYQRALKQRNIALRQGQPLREITPWNAELEANGLQIDAMRRDYLQRVATGIARHVRTTLDADVALTLERGWPDGQTLAEALDASYPRDAATGSTRTGPHRAELRIEIEGVRASDRASRGQGKVLAGALIGGQLESFQALTGRRATLLVDDLPAELDEERRARLWSVLDAIDAQKVITAIEIAALPAPLRSTEKRFHVEHGGRVKVV